MGAAIPIMHYTGMAAVSFSPEPLAHEDLSHAVNISSLGFTGIAAVTFMILGLVFFIQSLQLKSSEQRYHQIVERALDAFIGMDPHGLITHWNAQAETIFGWPRAEAIGKSVSERIIPDRHRSEHKEWLRDFSTANESIGLNKLVEVIAMRRDGREFPVELAIFVASTGAPRRFAAFVRDITERKRFERELIAAKDAAEAGSRAKGEFLANMSHEIRTPLNGIMGMTDLVMDTELAPEQRECLNTVKTSADSLLVVINDILDFSKMEGGKIDLEMIDFDLRDHFEETVKMLALSADQKGLELLCEIDSGVPEVMRGDSNRLRQIVVNLVGNAIKFTDAGEVALTAFVEAEIGDDRILHVAVADTGIGIAPGKQEVIFQEFAQADSTMRRRFGGAGLGLAISSRLVKAMGGKIWVESEVGRGTTMHFTVRLSISDSNIVRTAILVSPEILRNVRVLVVDDNRTNRHILEGVLTRWEMRPTLAASGEGALELLARARDAWDPFELILTDMHMPNMDGFTLIERIHGGSNASAATIMMLTSAGHHGDAMRCHQLGIAAYLLKPVRQSALREAIVRTLGAQRCQVSAPLVTRYALAENDDPTMALRVLVVDDNHVNRLVAKRIIEKKGHEVIVASSGREALGTLDKERFDIVLMDLQMPEMDGFEVTAAIRESERATGLHQPVIALTAHALESDRERCLAAGMDGYLSKPIRPDEINSLLDEYAARPNV